MKKRKSGQTYDYATSSSLFLDRIGNENEWEPEYLQKISDYYKKMGLIRESYGHLFEQSEEGDFVDAMAILRRLTKDGVGEAVGSAQFEQTDLGLIVKLKAEGVPPGEHGIHIHENPDVGPGKKDGKIQPGMAAGGHYDPMGTGKHLGPYGDGHLGDLPRAYALEDGTIDAVLLAPRLTLEDVRGRSIIVHSGGDNYSYKPDPMGGGKSRMMGGVIE